MEVWPNEVVVLVGPNGCGKTTLVEMLLGLRRRDRGVVEVFGKDPRKQRAELADLIGVTLQGASLHAQVTPREHLEFIAALSHRRTEDIDQVLRELGLAELQKRRFGRLSGGQQRRVLVGAALLPLPGLLVLDEPTSGVDLESRTQLWTVLRAASARHGTSVLTTTHDLTEAEDNADRVLVMRGGRIVGQGSPRQLVANTGLVAVVSLHFAGGDVLKAPRDPGIVVLQNELGAMLLGCRSREMCSAVMHWGNSLPGIRKVEPRSPALSDAYLMFSGGDVRRGEG